MYINELLDHVFREDGFFGDRGVALLESLDEELDAQIESLSQAKDSSLDDDCVCGVCRDMRKEERLK